MCRNIKTLFNFDPPATEEEMRQASLQFVRKLSGFTKPSKVNEEVFNGSVEEITKLTQRLLKHLQTNSKPRDRKVEEKHAREKAAKRFGTRQ